MAANLFVPYYVQHKQKAPNSNQAIALTTCGFMIENTNEHLVVAQHYRFPEGASRPAVGNSIKILKGDIIEFYPLKSAVTAVRVNDGVEEAVVIDAGVAAANKLSLVK